MSPSKKRTTRSSNARMGSLMPPIDVNDAKMVKELKKRIAKGPITLVFVYADWCGHCQAYKPKFEELEKNQNRSIQIARVRDDVYPSLGIKNGEIEGYPSVIAVSRENKALNFQDGEGNGSNTVPDHNNMTMMNSIVENGLPENAPKSNNSGNGKNSMNVSRPGNSQMNENISNAIENMPSAANVSTMPPDASKDSIYESQVVNRTKNNNSLVYKATQPAVMRGGDYGCSKIGQTGGSGGLYGLLSSVAYEAAAPALLLGTAAYLSKRGRRSAKTRKALKRRARSTRRK